MLMNSVNLCFVMLVFLNNAQESLRDAVKEVYKLNKFFSRQDFMKYTVEEDDLIIMEKGVGTCTQLFYKS
jgi:hypothetical protein